MYVSIDACFITKNVSYKQNYKRNLKKTGCSLVSDGWDDRQHRPLMNMIVVSPQGAMFLKTFNTTGHVKNSEYLAEIMDQTVQEIGVENVVQVVTDNAPVCVAALRILESRYPSIVVSTCVAHSVDLMLEDIGKLPNVTSLIKKAKQVCKTVCNHHASLAVFKSHSQKMILRPNDTRQIVLIFLGACLLTTCLLARFGTVIIMLQRLVDVRKALERTVTDQGWDDFFRR